MTFEGPTYDDSQQYFIIQDQATWVVDTSMPEDLSGMILKESYTKPALYIPFSSTPYGVVRDTSDFSNHFI